MLTLPIMWHEDDPSLTSEGLAVTRGGGRGCLTLNLQSLVLEPNLFSAVTVYSPASLARDCTRVRLHSPWLLYSEVTMVKGFRKMY